MEARLCVCRYVCVSVCACVCGKAAAQMDESIFMKFYTNDLRDICEFPFSRILHFEINDVIAAILYVFLCGTLTVAILLRFSSKFNARLKVVFHCLLFKISKIGWLLPPIWRTAFSKKKSKWPPIFFFETRQVRCLFRLKLTS